MRKTSEYRGVTHLVRQLTDRFKRRNYGHKSSEIFLK